ncbi:MAG TPA: hypothetical protein VFJ99_04365 [Solirubrobacterales bacterium]|nr:hypothetical protein [Solirubrobacterales bacterium]
MHTESDDAKTSEAQATRGGSRERRVRSQIRKSMLERARSARKRLPSSPRAA